MFQAIKLGKHEIVNHLLTKRPKLIKAQNAFGMTPLHCACRFDELKIARILLE